MHSVRFLVFSIIDNLMARNRDGTYRDVCQIRATGTDIPLALKKMGKAFLSGYASLAEGEKDPRNLLVAFAIARVILIEFDIAEHVEVCIKSSPC